VSQNISSATAIAKAPARSQSRIEAIGIVIATRNHATDIAKCIAGLFAANSHSGWHHSLWIVVVADASSDDTAKIARRALGAFGQVLEISAQSRQAAHRIGAAAVIDHFRDIPRHSLLMTGRDATATVACDWIDQQINSSRTPFGLT
jgi:glycosyltransferase involved in cell wall biosynthesis